MVHSMSRTMAATGLVAAAALLVPLLLGLTEVNTSYVDHNIKGSPDLYDFTTGTIALCGILLQALSKLTLEGHPGWVR